MINSKISETLKHLRKSKEMSQADLNNLFASRLTDLLEEHRLSKRKFTKMIDVSASSVADWSNGKV